MTTESQKAFEEWLAMFRQAHNGHLPTAYEAWQASEARILALLESDEMVKKVAEAIASVRYGELGFCKWKSDSCFRNAGHKSWHYKKAKAALKAIAEMIK